MEIRQKWTGNGQKGQKRDQKVDKIWKKKVNRKCTKMDKKDKSGQKMDRKWTKSLQKLGKKEQKYTEN